MTALAMEEKITRYISMIYETNKVMNLTGFVSPEEIRVNLVDDSRILCPYIKEKQSVADIGSGAGIPGIICAILRPDLAVTLIESTQKKANFLSLAKRELELPNITVVAKRAETAAETFREQFDLVLARHVARLDSLIELAIPFLKINGIFIAMKSEQLANELELAQAAINELFAVLYDHKTYSINNHQRDLLFFTKTQSTPLRFPRREGLAQNKPIN